MGPNFIAMEARNLGPVSAVKTWLGPACLPFNQLAPIHIPLFQPRRYPTSHPTPINLTRLLPAVRVPSGDITSIVARILHSRFSNSLPLVLPTITEVIVAVSPILLIR